jgi:heptosyltransferase-2
MIPPESQNASSVEISDRRPAMLVVELWGIGDLAMATPLLQAALARYEVTLLAKPHARALLARTYPQLKFIEWDAPWSAFTGKYRLWSWNWSALRRVLHEMRAGNFAIAVTGRRADPREHLLMLLARIPRRVGFPYRGTPGLLNDPINPGPTPRHIVEDWRALALHLDLDSKLEPRLDGQLHPRVDVAAAARPVLCLHVGSRIPVRRWPEKYFADVIQRLRARFQFELILIADPDGYGLGLAPLADRTIETIGLDELVGVLSSAAMVLCNDSGPGHVAAACGGSVLAIFGPGDPNRCYPWGSRSGMIIRDLCPYRPCFDYCRFPEPYCLTKLTVDEVWPEIESFATWRLRSP